jgi:uncharacterized protein (TIGR02147 family)
MWIEEYDDYKLFLKDLIATYPKRGRGQLRRLAENLNIGPIVVSHILSKDRHFTQDQAAKTARFFGLDETSTEYFIFLVSLAKADSNELKAFCRQKLKRLKTNSQNLKNVVVKHEELSDADKGRFYSNWYYSGVRILSSIEGFQTIESIAEYFGLSRTKIGEVVSFLVEKGLCVQEGGRIRHGPMSTYVDEKSEYVNNHRRNWRDKARDRFSEPGENDMFFSSPVSISHKDSDQFRKELQNVVKTFSKKVLDSPEEKLMCLNIDWFEF